MKISFSAILEKMMKRLSDKEPFHQSYFFEQSINLEKKNNIEKIFGEVFSSIELDRFDELSDFLKEKKKSDYLGKFLIEFKKIVEFYRFISSENEDDRIVHEIFKGLEYFGMDRDSELLKVFEHISDHSDNQKNLGYLNHLVWILTNYHFNLRYVDPIVNLNNLNEKRIEKFNLVVQSIQKNIDSTFESGSNSRQIILNLTNVCIEIKSSFEKVFSDMMKQESNSNFNSLPFMMLFAQAPLYYFENQTNILIKSLESLTEQDINTKFWLELFNKLIEILNQAKSIYGFAHVLEKTGIEVEKMSDALTKLYQLTQLKIVEITKVEKHPQADKLNICTIFDGQETKQVVCGGENVNHIFNNKLKTVYANVGQIIPNHMVLEPREIRGIVSNGMLCSTSELCIDFSNNEAIGIVELLNGAVSGCSPLSYMAEKFNLSIVFDISITPNLDKAIGLNSLEFLIWSYICDRNFNNLSSSGCYLYEKRLGKDENSKICRDFVENNVKSVVDNIFLCEICNLDKYLETNHRVKMILKSHEFEIQNNIMDLINLHSIYLGAVPHIIDSDKAKGKLKIVENSKLRDSLQINDVIITDEEDNLVVLPGLCDSIDFTFDPKTTKSLHVIYLVFTENTANEIDVGFNRMLQIARRNRLANKMIYFYERARIDESYFYSNTELLCDVNLLNSFVFSCTNVDISNARYWVKCVDLNIRDVLMCFKKQAISDFIEYDQEKSDEHHCIHRDVLRFAIKILINLGIVDSGTPNRPSLNTYEEDNDLCAVVLVFKHHTNINSSMDLMAEIIKFIDFKTNQRAIREGVFEEFLIEQTSFSEKRNKTSGVKDAHKYFDFERISNKKFYSNKYSEHGSMILDNNLKKNLVGRGFSEVCNFSFIDETYAVLNEKYLVNLLSPVDKTLSTLRPSIFISLLSNLVEILKISRENIAIFECSSVYTSYNIFQRNISGIRAGRKSPRNIHYDIRKDFDFYDIKADLLEGLRAYNITEENLKFIRVDELAKDEILMSNLNNLFLIKEESKINQHALFFHPGKSAIVCFEGVPLAYLGELHPKILQNYDITVNVCGFSILMEQLHGVGLQKRKPLFESIYQFTERDFAIIFDEKITIGEIEQSIRNESKLHSDEILQKITFFDIYRDEKLISDNKKSVGFNLRLQSKKETLSDKKIIEFTNKVLKRLKEEFDCHMIVN